MPNLVSFTFNNTDIIAIEDEHGNPWLKASDVCQQCGIKNVSDACDRLDADEKAVIVLTDSDQTSTRNAQCEGDDLCLT
jgi:prophage antirepressor-like protein